MVGTTRTKKQHASSHSLPSRGLFAGADMKLTQKTIAALALPEGKTETIVFDEDLPGFGLRIRAGGTRSWIFQYKIGNQNRRITLGTLAALTPARARETAGDLHARFGWAAIRPAKRSKAGRARPKPWAPSRSLI